jgi:uncharacterized protein (DUF2141 family)
MGGAVPRLDRGCQSETLDGERTNNKNDSTGGSMLMSRAIAIILVLSSIFGAASIRADEAASGNAIKVIVVDLHGNEGQVSCALFSSVDGFPNVPAKAIKLTTAKIENRQAVCNFSGIAPGDYGVSVFHDENSNGKLDSNFIGIPKEGVGASNDAAGKFGPPKFDDARFNYPGGPKTLTIHIRYL